MSTDWKPSSFNIVSYRDSASNPDSVIVRVIADVDTIHFNIRFSGTLLKNYFSGNADIDIFSK